MMQKGKNIRILVAILIGLFISALILVIIYNQRFRILRISPSGVLPTSSNVIELTFNKSLGDLSEQGDAIIVLPDIPASVSINDNVLRIQIQTLLDEGVKVVIELNQLQSTDGDFFDGRISLPVEYVPFDRLSTDEQERQVKDSTLSTDSNPLLSELPYDQIAYRIDYILDETKYDKTASFISQKENYAITINTFARQSGVTQDEYAKETRILRQLALDWIKDRGVDPDNDIQIVYYPNDAEIDGNEIFGD